MLTERSEVAALPAKYPHVKHDWFTRGDFAVAAVREAYIESAKVLVEFYNAALKPSH